MTEQELTPKKIVKALADVAPIQAATLVKSHYINLPITAAGIITDVNIWTQWITLSFHDKDQILISANFKTPVSSYISSLNIGDHISLKGYLYNATKNIVVLDNCEVWSGDKKSDKNEPINIETMQVHLDKGDNVGVNKITKIKNKNSETFLEKFFWQIIALLFSIVALAISRWLRL